MPQVSSGSVSNGRIARDIVTDEDVPQAKRPKPDAKIDRNTSNAEPEYSEVEVIERSNEELLWEPATPARIDLEELDLDRSYVKDVEILPPLPKLPKRQKRWRYRGGKPLTDYKNLPKGWNSREPDLDPFDIDAQIARCHERIEDNIMPCIFEERLKEYELGKAARDKMALGEPKGLSWPVLQRIDNLKLIRTQLCEQDDPHAQIENVDAILNAYRTGKLDWTDGLVTYWSWGQQICQPRPFSWDEFHAINTSCKGTKSFWTEGLHKPQGSVEMASIRIQPSPTNRDLHFINVAVRLVGVPYWTELHYLHDTGADAMSIFEGDLPRILGPFRPPRVANPPLLGVATIRPAIGPPVTVNVTRLEVTLLNEKGEAMAPWTTIECHVKPGNYVPGSQSYRSDGPALRSLLYQAYAPDGRDLLYIANKKHSLHLPRFVHPEVKTPHGWFFPGPTFGKQPPPPPGMPVERRPAPPRARGVRP